MLELGPANPIAMSIENHRKATQTQIIITGKRGHLHQRS